ncbi:MAG: glycosyltransferase [Sediminibacterium sp.]|nr:glycosyltransferase [Sediminibacterium sp.]
MISKDLQGIQMNVTQIVRKSDRPNSVDRILGQLNPILSTKVNLRVLTCPNSSEGIKNKLANLNWARHIKDDVVHLTGDINYLSFAISSPLVTTVLDLGMPGKMAKWKHKIFHKIWIDYPVSKSKVVITISDKIRDEILERNSKYSGKVCTIYVPVGKEFVPFQKVIPSSSFRILHVATSAHNKNTFRMAQALNGLDVHYRIVGIVPDETRNYLIAENIPWSHGSHLSDQEMLDEYVKSDLVVFPSLYEGFGMPIVEAQSVGRVVLTSKLDPMLEIAGKGAIFVDPFDIPDIRNGIIDFMQNSLKRDTLIQEGFKNIERFKLESIAAQYLGSYENAL